MHPTKAERMWALDGENIAIVSPGCCSTKKRLDEGSFHYSRDNFVPGWRNSGAGMARGHAFGDVCNGKRLEPRVHSGALIGIPQLDRSKSEQFRPGNRFREPSRAIRSDTIVRCKVG